MNNSSKMFKSAMDMIFAVVKLPSDTRRILMALFASGAHFSLPGIPGTAKTLLMKTFSIVFSKAEAEVVAKAGETDLFGAPVLAKATAKASKSSEAPAPRSVPVASMIACTADMTGINGSLDPAALVNRGEKVVVWNPALESKVVFLDEVNNLTPHTLREGPQKWMGEQLAAVTADTDPLALPKGQQIISCFNPGDLGTFDLPKAFASRKAAYVFLPAMRPTESFGHYFPGMFDDDQPEEAKPVANVGLLDAVRAEVAALPFSVEGAAAVTILTTATTTCKYNKESMSNFPADCASVNGGKGCDYLESGCVCRFITPAAGRLAANLKQVSQGIAYVDGASQVTDRHVRVAAPFVMGHVVQYLEPNAPSGHHDKAKAMVERLFNEIQPAINLLVNAQKGKAKASEIEAVRKNKAPNLFMMDILPIVERMMDKAAKRSFDNIMELTVEQIRETVEIAPPEVAKVLTTMLEAHTTISGETTMENLEDSFFQDDVSKTVDGEVMLSRDAWTELISQRKVDADQVPGATFKITRETGGVMVLSIIFPVETVEIAAELRAHLENNSPDGFTLRPVYHGIGDLKALLPK